MNARQQMLIEWFSSVIIAVNVAAVAIIVWVCVGAFKCIKFAVFHHISIQITFILSFLSFVLIIWF